MYTPQESTQIQIWRQKVTAGTITKEELKEALAMLAKGRGAAAAVSATSRASKAPKKPVDADALLNELDGL